MDGHGDAPVAHPEAEPEDIPGIHHAKGDPSCLALNTAKVSAEQLDFLFCWRRFMMTLCSSVNMAMDDVFSRYGAEGKADYDEKRARSTQLHCGGCGLLDLTVAFDQITCL